MKDQNVSMNDFTAVGASMQCVRSASSRFSSSSAIESPQPPMTRQKLIAMLDAAINIADGADWTDL
jgi:hypothetical protein